MHDSPVPSLQIPLKTCYSFPERSLGDCVSIPLFPLLLLRRNNLRRLDSISGLNGPWPWPDPPGFTRLRDGRLPLQGLACLGLGEKQGLAVNNRKRKAADSAEIFHDRPDRDDQSRGEGRRERRGRGRGREGRAEKGKCDGAQGY